ncbi:MAG: PQQ-binding-like beta-propeller repeat protein [Candidatus Aquilonibacter sp.]|jgi:glucose dehydrogenase
MFGPRLPPPISRPISAQLQDAYASTSWLTYGHDYTNQRFSPLDQINTRNVSSLAPAYVVQTGVVGPLETTPIVSDGVMYLTTAFDGVLAIDARTGDQLWKRPPLSGRFRLCCGPMSRGAAVTNDLVLLGQLDGVLVALDRKTGGLRWATAVADNAAGYSITMAPLVYRDSVLIGVAGGDLGIRGSLSSYSTVDGKLQWRWYSTDPEHWFGPSTRLRSDHRLLDLATSLRLRRKFANSWQHGGGGIWTTPAIDLATDTIYVVTGNPWPDTSGQARPGDNLYTDSLVALSATTGAMKWYYQQTPHDVQDLDAASPPVLFDTIDATGRRVRAVCEVGKTGFVYILNRDTGKPVRTTRPDVGPSARNYTGGSTWSPASFDPALGYAIVSTSQHLRAEDEGAHSENTRNSSLRGVGWSAGFGNLTALNAATGNVVWQDRFDVGLVGGSVSTASGLTFVGEGSGYFDALETKTGLRLWRFQTGAGVNAAPIVFELDGAEYVAVASGGNQQFGTRYGDAIFVFKLRN